MKEFQTENFLMKISDDLIKEIIIKKNIVFSPEDMSETMRLSINAFKPDSKFYVLLEGEDGSSVSNAAKRLAANEEYSKHTNALALCSTNTLQAIAGNLFLKINRPKTPTRFFEDRTAALKWLQDLSNQSK